MNDFECAHESIHQAAALYLHTGGKGAKLPLKAESILVIRRPTEPANLAPFLKCLAQQGMNGLTVSIA